VPIIFKEALLVVCINLHSKVQIHLSSFSRGSCFLKITNIKKFIYIFFHSFILFVNQKKMGKRLNFKSFRLKEEF
jgi:hypothetical protein